MNEQSKWLVDLECNSSKPTVDGLILVKNYDRDALSIEQVVMMEKAESFGAHSVFFESRKDGRTEVAQAFIYVSDGPANDSKFAETHQRLWSWGGVPLVYRKIPGLIQLFRCAHKPDFLDKSGNLICNPIDELKTTVEIENSPIWWNAETLRNGTLWDDLSACTKMLSAGRAAHRSIFKGILELHKALNKKRYLLPEHLKRRLLILTLITAYLDQRKAFPDNYFSKFLPGAKSFFEVLKDGEALVKLLIALKKKFNGHVFDLDESDLKLLGRSSQHLEKYAHFVEARTEPSGQRTLWELYSFKDLPVELISNIYQIFVDDKSSSVYTPPFLVRLMLDEALSEDAIDRLHDRDEVILDPACGSGVFLVEAYKRLVLHWRKKNGWERPDKNILQELIKKVHGVDLEEGAVQLSAFSLCLAMCDALEPEEIRSSIRLFPPLKGKSLHNSCFFKAIDEGLIQAKVGVVVGNPPFKSKLTTRWAKQSAAKYKSEYGAIPDQQLAYLFLNDAMKLLAQDGILCMLQNYNFLYNSGSRNFRQSFFAKWKVREVLDFISVRGLFTKGDADTKVVVIVANASLPDNNQKILHATFRRSGRVHAELGFDINYYDLHWVRQNLILTDDRIWRANLLGGERVLQFIEHLQSHRTLSDFANAKNWDFGEGFIIGEKGKRSKAPHITGKNYLPSDALDSRGIDPNQILTCDSELFHTAYTKKRYSSPMLLIKENMELHHDVWEDGYLTYKARIVGFCAPSHQAKLIRDLGKWIEISRRPLQAFIAATSPSVFAQKSTAVAADEILKLPYPINGDLGLSTNERIVADDIVDYYRDIVRLGQNSPAMRESGEGALPAFTEIYKTQINAIYKDTPLKVLAPQFWSGVICQPFVFGQGAVDWHGAHQLKGKLEALLHAQAGTALNITRIARIYDGNFVFLLKPDRLRYWLRSVALRDADDTLTDLQAQGF